MEYKTKSLNCESCAASLIKKMDSNICKCTYCGNTNIILADGKVVVKNIDTSFQLKPIEIGNEKRSNNKPINKYLIFFIAILSLFGGVIFLLHRYRKKRDTRIFEKGGLVSAITN